MRNKELFDLFEIEPTDDETAIKKAYARKIRKVHPEENPKEWKKVRDAYDTLLNSARINKKYAGQREFFPTEEEEDTSEYYDPEEDFSLDKNDEPADELDSAVDRIVETSAGYHVSGMALREAVKLLKSVPSLCRTYYGEYAPDYENLSRLRGSNFYPEALKDKNFTGQYMTVLKYCVLPVEWLDKILKDLEKAEQVSEGARTDYTAFRRLLERKKEEVRQIEKKNKAKHKLRDGWSLFSRLFGANYNLMDYVDAGAGYAIDPSSKARTSEGNMAYVCELVIENEVYPIVLLQDNTTEKYKVRSLFYPAYDTADECAEISKRIRDFYEGYYEKHKFKVAIRWLFKGIVLFLILLCIIGGLMAVAILIPSELTKGILVGGVMLAIGLPVLFRSPFWWRD